MGGRIDKMLFGEVVVSDTIGVSDGFTKLLLSLLHFSKSIYSSIYLGMTDLTFVQLSIPSLVHSSAGKVAATVREIPKQKRVDGGWLNGSIYTCICISSSIRSVGRKSIQLSINSIVTVLTYPEAAKKRPIYTLKLTFAK